MANKYTATTMPSPGSFARWYLCLQAKFRAIKLTLSAMFGKGCGLLFRALERTCGGSNVDCMLLREMPQARKAEGGVLGCMSSPEAVEKDSGNCKPNPIF